LRVVNLIGAGDSKMLDRIADVMTVARFSPDGKHIACGGADNIIRIYDAASSQRLHSIEQHADWITDLIFSPDGKQLISASRDKSCRVFDVESGQMRSASVDLENAAFAIAQDPDGKTIYSAGRDGKVLCWNAADGKKKAEIPLLADVFRLRMTSGGLVAACSDGMLRYYSASQHELIREEHLFNDWSYTLALSRDGKLLAAGCHDGTVCILNAASGAEVSRFIAIVTKH
jgi:WD40 repeat protein